MLEISSAQPAADDSYRVPGLEKGLDVIELLAGTVDGLSLRDLAERLERTSQELFRVVSTLVARGYLLRDPAGRYRTSMKLFELGNRHAATQALVARAMPHMERLAETVGESCHLSIVVQDRMLVVARAECAADVRIAVRVGATYDMHLRVSGRVAMAWMPSERREEYYRRRPEGESVSTSLESELARIRADGHVAADSPIIVGGQDFAAPVLSSDSVLAVLCLSRLSRVGEKPRREEFTSAVARCAAAISAEFGQQELAQPQVRDTTSGFQRRSEQKSGESGKRSRGRPASR
jgi:DNA-binding IclR family transcriptional regulator